MRIRAGEINIRKVQPEDYEATLSLIRQIPGQNRWRFDGSGFGQTFESLVKGEAQEAYVATLRQRVIGFVSLYYMRVLHHGGMVASIQELVVTEELRGRGIGRALVDFAKARAEELRCSGFELATSLPNLGRRLHAWRDCGQNQQLMT